MLLDFKTFNFKTACVVFLSAYLLCTSLIIFERLNARFSQNTDSGVLTLDSYMDSNSKLSISNERVNKAVLAAQMEYPFPIQNNYELSPREDFEVTLVTYFDAKDHRFFLPYYTRWTGPAIVVVYYFPDEENEWQTFQQSCKTQPRVRCIPYKVTESPVPINRLKNIGIDSVLTSHYIFAESNLAPTSNLYNDLLKTPGYLWRDSAFIGVIPVYEWSSDEYSDSQAAYQRFDRIINGPSSLSQCLKSYHCRPLVTSTNSLQFRWFSYINYRAMNCIDRNTEIYMVLKKSGNFPRYDERVTERGFDNVEYVEKIRHMNVKMAQLAANFFFRVSGVGVDSTVVLENQKRGDLQKQFSEIRDAYEKTLPNDHPIVNCEEIEPAMYGWVSFRKYTWMEEERKDNVLYPKIAVDSAKNVDLAL